MTIKTTKMEQKIREVFNSEAIRKNGLRKLKL